MRTEDLISTLAAAHGPVDRHRTRRLVLGAALVSFAVAGVAVVLRLGARPDLMQILAEPRAAAKLIFAVGAVLAALWSVLRLSRPGAELSETAAVLALPFAFVLSLAALELSWSPPEAWPALVFGASWSYCLTSIPLYAVLPFALLVLTLREAAPTDLRGAGFATGVLAGSLATLAYELHCTEDAMPFVAAWYAGTIVAIGVLGALVVPRVVRW
ncbi:DUF1109 domain-containing protein [Prosthecomicrobium sp. N25]|uniref:DUF1109 domain-containing protein n=1 Tax=Prosthecomicrobium sp. N25 TaxID=3129254 RepID=UPI0030770EA3